MSSSSPVWLDLIFFCAFLAILFLFLRRFYLKRKPIAQKIYTGGGPRTEKPLRKELQSIDAGVVIIPDGSTRTSIHWQKYKEGNAHLDAQRLDEAIAVFKELAAIPEEAGTALIGLGTSYNLKGERELAMNCFQKALELDDKDFNALLGMASVNYKAAHYSNAVVYYKKANALKPELPDAYWGLACAYHMMKEKELASENAKTFIKMVPDSRYRKYLEGMIIN